MSIYEKLETAINEAKVLEAKGKWEEAIQAYLKIIESFPNARAEVMERIANIWKEKLHNLEAAEKAYHAALSEDPNRLGSLYSLASILEEMERWKEAIEIHKEIASRSTNLRGEALEKVGDIYRDRLKQLNSAEEAYKHSLDSEPGRVSAAYELALVIKEMGRKEEAQAALLALKKEHPDKPEIAISLAKCYEEWQEYDKAISVYQELIDKGASLIEGISPEDFPPELQGMAKELTQDSLKLATYVSLSFKKAKEGKVKEAESELINMYRNKPWDLVLVTALAYFYEKQGRWEEAILMYKELGEKFSRFRGASLEKIGDIFKDNLKILSKAAEAYIDSLKVEPGRTGAVYRLYQILKSQGKIHEAENLIEDFRRTQGDKVELLSSLAEDYEKESRWEDLIKICQEIYDNFSDFRAIAMHKIAFGYGELEKYEEAIRGYDHASELDPCEMANFNNKGYCQLRKGDYTKAISTLDKAISMAPNTANPYAHKGKALLALKRYEEALDSLEMAVSLNPEKYNEELNEPINRCREAIKEYPAHPPNLQMFFT